MIAQEMWARKPKVGFLTHTFGRSLKTPFHIL